MAADFRGFPRAMLEFLHQIETHNNRDWFQASKELYESDVRGPALDFIEAMAEPLEKISPHFRATPKKVGGSLMRVYRDIRFSRDKRPFKTNVGIQFRHELGKDVHAPGYYVHIDRNETFIGAGMWHPDREPLAAIRDRIAESPDEWTRVLRNRRFKKHYALSGSSLTRPPRGYDKEHRCIEDIKRKDFIAISQLDHEILFGPGLVSEITRLFRAATPLVRFL